MNWIESLLSRLQELWPFVTVSSFERGVRFRFGRDVAELEPGVHFAFWWFERIEVVPVVEQVMNLPTQSITTMDGATVTFSANIAYEVADARTMFTAVSDFQDSLSGLAMMHLAKRVREKEWAALQAEQAELEASLKGTLTTRAKRWGVTIVGVGLTDLVKARQMRLYGDPPVG